MEGGEQWKGEGHVPIEFAVAMYFITYILAVSIVALNIIVAVLLEGFRSSMEKHDINKRLAEEVVEHHKLAGALDPLLATLSNFTNPLHLKSQIDMLFDLWDVDATTTMDYNEMRVGALGLGYAPCIGLSLEDWEAFTVDGSLLNEQGEMDRKSFELAMRLQISEYSQRLLSNKMQYSIRNANENAPILFAFKVAMMELMDISAERRR
jgi:hypothetical protein